ncbi:MAG: hypothetical protein IH600_14030 [Bacteroidetes bacterium]|nr:hypothetical protein [Bacteroidota bacterium]
MTGFVFTFSLFCTAILNSDPAVLQRAELAAVRQIIEAVIPEARLHRSLRSRQTQPLLSKSLPDNPWPSILPSQRRCDENSVRFAPARKHLNARPIRAPSAW